MSQEPLAKKQKTGAEKPETVLYSYWRSSCSWRVRIALNLKNVPFEYKAVHLLRGGGEQFSEDYSAKNPSHELPTQLIDGNTLCQSLAIIEYLDETRPESALIGKDPITRANVRRQADLISGIQSVQNLRVLLVSLQSIDDSILFRHLKNLTCYHTKASHGGFGG